MPDEFSTAAVCGGGAGWWNPTRNIIGPSLCSAASMNDIGNFVWPNHDGEVALMQDNERGDRNYGFTLQEDLNYGQETGEQSTNNTEEFSFCHHHQTLTSITNSYNNYPPNLLKSMFDTDPQTHQHQCLSDFSTVTATTTKIYGQNLTGDLSSPTNNNICLWNSSANNTSLNDVGSCFFPSLTFADDKKSSVATGKSNNGSQELRDSSFLANKTSDEPVFKRPRIETPSPLPTFKVRKEKLGDRITALQQLVSPFGRTDTASVLQEAIEYIKFHHDQVNVLITPYVKNGSRSNQQCQQVLDQEGSIKQDLRSRGLCVVPMLSTFPVTAETTTDFWTPTFGKNFR